MKSPSTLPSAYMPQRVTCMAPRYLQIGLLLLGVASPTDTGPSLIIEYKPKQGKSFGSFVGQTVTLFQMSVSYGTNHHPTSLTHSPSPAWAYHAPLLTTK